MSLHDKCDTFSIEVLSNLGYSFEKLLREVDRLTMRAMVAEVSKPQTHEEQLKELIEKWGERSGLARRQVFDSDLETVLHRAQVQQARAHYCLRQRHCDRSGRLELASWF